MTQIGARVAAADAAGAIRIDGPLVLRIARVLDEHAAFAGVEAGMARGSRGEDAVHHVDAKGDVVGDLFGAADAHEIAGTVFGEECGDFGGHFAGRLVRLADGESADRIAGKIEVEKLTGAFPAQVGKSCALNNSELPLRQVAVALRAFLKIVASASSPRGGSCDGGFGMVARRGRFDTFIEDHGDIRAERELNLYGLLRGKEMLRTIEMRAEAHAFVGHFSKRGETEDLVTAGIGKDGARPGHELMQAAELAHEFMAGTQIKMIGIREDDFRAEVFERFLGERFDGGLGANGHEEWGFDGAVWRGQAATAGTGRVGFCYVKRKTHTPSLSEENPRNHCET